MLKRTACYRGVFARGLYAPSSTLLNLGHVELEEAVHPCQEFLTVRLRQTSAS